MSSGGTSCSFSQSFIQGVDPSPARRLHRLPQRLDNNFKLIPAAEDGPALILLYLVLANIRNCTLPSSCIRAFDIPLALYTLPTDGSKLDDRSVSLCRRTLAR